MILSNLAVSTKPEKFIFLNISIKLYIFYAFIDFE